MLVSPTDYMLNVSAGFTGNLFVTQRQISRALGAGSYTVSSVATTACGWSAASAPETVTIP